MFITVSTKDRFYANVKAISNAGMFVELTLSDNSTIIVDKCEIIKIGV